MESFKLHLVPISIQPYFYRDMLIKINLNTDVCEPSSFQIQCIILDIVPISD